MPKRKRLVPFKFLPASWGLGGRAREEAEAHYYLDGEDLDRRLLEIRFADDPDRLARERLDLDLAHGRLDEFAHAVKLAEIEHPEPGVERNLAVLEAEWRLNRIERNEYEKRRASLQQQPWVGILDYGFDPSQGINGVYFEFDWNEYWIEYLKLNGYVGVDDEQIVERWFSDVCRAQALADLTEEERLELRFRL